jgi:hypothetical protein
MRGQAMVEAALVMPILLLVILGGIAISISVARIEIDRYELLHAASEGAIAGASKSTLRCMEARSVARRILGRRPSENTCDIRAGMVVLTLSETLTLYDPYFKSPYLVSQTSRAAIR